ncbi:MAG: hypothetical protein HZB79_07625 [Deltaproteobacteria bacterium]|nr:hypothetical protein [Deltaproteobacteria bacterium]
MYKTKFMTMTLSIILFWVSFIENSFAFKVSTHRIITKEALTMSQNYNNFIKDFNISGTQAVIDGSEWEDGENLLDMRWFNHYYDPVNQKGLNVSGISYGRISKDWAYDGGSGQSGYTHPNNYSWVKAREYMYIGLTGRDFSGNFVAETSKERSTYLQKMFRSIGQVVHIVEDLAQPSHVRNDPHASHGEVPVLPYVLNPSHLEDWSQNNGALVYSFTKLSDSAKALPSYNNYFNGLAYLTSTNFFSDDTIFKNYYYPSREQTDIDKFTFINFLSIVVDEDGKISKTVYVTKTGGALTGYKAAHAGYFWNDISSHVIGGLSSLQFNIDDRVAEDNAKVLIPKAVEYSAGLLNYFFRGQINMEKDPNNSSQYVIKNESNEDMNGTFSLCYDDASDNRKCFVNWDLQITAGQSKSVSFTAPTSPEPKEKGKYILAFQGTLGNEAGAVVGKVVKLCGGDATITISGPDAPSNGSKYTATGGEKPYTWSISKGSITQDGVVTVSGQCGTATITVKDSCGNKTTKDVRLPGGTWVFASYWDAPYSGELIVYGGYLWYPSYIEHCEVISGISKTGYNIGQWAEIDECTGTWCESYCKKYPDRCDIPLGLPCSPSNLNCSKPYICALTSSNTFEWRCP